MQAMLTLVSSKQPLLELRGARGLGRIAFKAPFYCPTPNKVVVQTKAEIAQAGGITALIGVPHHTSLHHLWHMTATTNQAPQ